MTALLEVRNLTTRFDTDAGTVKAVNNVSFSINPGEILGIVGESGSGKSQIFLSLMGLLAKNGTCQGQVLFQNTDLLTLNRPALDKIRGVSLSMIFQDPMTSLNPSLRISQQMTEVLVEHEGQSAQQALNHAIEMLDRVGIPDARKRIHMYPHEFSGGMRQRVMIAMALLCKPDLLIADEPTTALDVTIQAQILKLLRDLSRDFNMAIAMITHDLGVVASLCDQVMVLYGGRVMEYAPVSELFKNPMHPYTAGLMTSLPHLDHDPDMPLSLIPGHPPNLQNMPAGCPFHPRCPDVQSNCHSTPPKLYQCQAAPLLHHSACHQHADKAEVPQ